MGGQERSNFRRCWCRAEKKIKLNANLEYSPFNHLKIYKSYKETQNNLALGQVDSIRRSIDPMKNES